MYWFHGCNNPYLLGQVSGRKHNGFCVKARKVNLLSHFKLMWNITSGFNIYLNLSIIVQPKSGPDEDELQQEAPVSTFSSHSANIFCLYSCAFSSYDDDQLLFYRSAFLNRVLCPCPCWAICISSYLFMALNIAVIFLPEASP
jgi:hypothetical protein